MKSQLAKLRRENDQEMIKANIMPNKEDPHPVEIRLETHFMTVNTAIAEVGERVKIMEERRRK